MRRTLGLLVLVLAQPVLAFAQNAPQALPRMIIEPGFAPVVDGAIAVYDFDSDGDDDLAVTGRKRGGTPTFLEQDYYHLSIYRSDASGLVDVTPEYEGVGEGLPYGFGRAPKLRWADLDGDGDGDLIAAGTILSSDVTHPLDDRRRDWAVKVYRNDGNAFVDASEGLPSVSLGVDLLGVGGNTQSLTIVDVDGDGHLDFHVYASGSNDLLDEWTVGDVYVSRGERFERWVVPLPSGFSSFVEVIDLDQDGDGDLVAVSAGRLLLLRNDAGVFANTGIEIPQGHREWVDLDGDGDLDLHLADAGTLLRNDGQGFVPTGRSVPALGVVGSVQWSDVDADGRLDVLLVGRTADQVELAELHRDTGAGYSRTDGFEAWSGGRGALADLAGDGFPDVVVSASHGLRIRPNQGGVVRSLPIMEPLYEPLASWVDLDSDGDRDLLLMGVGLDLLPSAHFYRNEGGRLTEIACPVPQFIGDAAAWFDADNDGDVDLVLAARDADYTPVTMLYWNDAGTLRLSSQALPEVGAEAVLAAVDFDDDGWMDLSMAGRGLTRLLRNDHGTLVDSGVVLPGLVEPGLAWADFDADGDFDLALGGFEGLEQPGTGLYRNDRGTFVHDSRLQSLFAPLDWVDLTGDGRWELVDAAFTVYRVHPDSAEVLHAPTWNWRRDRVRAWSDLDGDGDLDVITAEGRMEEGTESLWSHTAVGIYSESGFAWTSLSDVGVGTSVDNLAYAVSGHAALNFADWDGDGDRDLHLAGITELGPMQWTWIAHSEAPHEPVPPPTNLRATTDGVRVTFHWDAPDHPEEAAPSWTYNLFVGTSPGASDLVSAAADPSTGSRYASGPGNVGMALRRTVSLEAPGPYYWGVQAVDRDERGGQFGFSSGDPVSIALEPPDSAPTLRTGIGATYPNPFNPRVVIEYSVDRLQHIELAVFDLSGRRVRVLYSGPREAAEYRAIWDGSDQNGGVVASGTYFVRLAADERLQARKVMLVR